MEKAIDRHIALRLKERRLALGLTQAQLADALGLSYQQIHKYEDRINRISIGRLFSLAAALAVEVGYFFEGLEGKAQEDIPNSRQNINLLRNFNRIAKPEVRDAMSHLARALGSA